MATTTRTHTPPAPEEDKSSILKKSDQRTDREADVIGSGLYGISRLIVVATMAHEDFVDAVATLNT
jgi:hypothetical protein